MAKEKLVTENADKMSFPCFVSFTSSMENKLWSTSAASIHTKGKLVCLSNFCYEQVFEFEQEEQHNTTNIILN